MSEKRDQDEGRNLPYGSEGWVEEPSQEGDNPMCAKLENFLSTVFLTIAMSRSISQPRRSRQNDRGAWIEKHRGSTDLGTQGSSM